MGDLDARPSKVKKQAGLVERKVCFISDAGNWGWGVGGWTSVHRPIPPTDKQGIRAFIDRVGIGVTCRNSTVISDSHLQLVISGLTSIMLLVLGTVNLQFGCAFVPISFQSVLRTAAAQVQVQSGYHVVNSSTWCFGTYKTAHRIRLRILSIDFEIELNGLDCS